MPQLTTHYAPEQAGNRIRHFHYSCVLYTSCVVLIAALLAIFPSASTVAQQLKIIIANPIKVRPSELTPLAIELSPPGALPDSSFLRLRGLPSGTKLTQGYRVSDTTWAVPITGLPNLSLQLPPTARGSQNVDVQVVGVDGAVHAQQKISIVAGSAQIPLSRAAQPNALPTDQAQRTQSKPIDASTPAANGSQDPQIQTIRRTQRLMAPTLGSNSQINETQNEKSQTGRSTKPSSTSSVSEDADFRAERMFKRGNTFLLDGNLNTARQHYRRSADLGLASAAIALASTYDPTELEKLGIRDIPPEPEKARRWYKRAIALGATEIQQRLERLPPP
ncbi:MAG: hypothetical protein ACR2PG_18220 [Hyphomicrobiaceae bacterium]